MSFLILFISVLIILTVGFFLGGMIALASHYLSVKREERIDRVEAVLPGANCGACGYAGCSAYAEAIVTAGAPLNKCPSLTSAGLSSIAEIMGQCCIDSREPEKAFIACHAVPFDRNSQAFLYQGMSDCNSRFLFYRGSRKCKYGCLGGGSCVEVCPVQAIFKDRRGRYAVDRDKCISCGKCVEVCPMNVIRMLPESADYAVACSHPGKAAETKRDCPVGCLGCTLCLKKSPDGGFFMDRGLAQIDYSQNGDRKEAAEKCPVHCILEICR